VTAAVGEPRRENRLLMLAGHYSWVLLVWLVVLTAAADAANREIGWLNLAASVTWAAWWVMMLLVDKCYHAPRLCERCIAATPLDPQASVDRWLRFLRMEHEPGRWLLVLLAAFGLALWGDSSFHHWLGDVTDFLLMAVLVTVYTAEYVHRRFYPWCPFCHWEDGGDHEDAPDVPAPTVSV
jgi:hypothetical protein